MAKLTLGDIGNFNVAALNRINENSRLIEGAIENTLSRNGLSPNQMEADFDMNHHDIVNLDTLETKDVVVNGVSIVETYGQLQDFVDQAGSSAAIAVDAAGKAEAAKDAAEAAAGANLSNVDSVVTAISTNFPPFITYVRTAGYYAAGDKGGALYKKVASEPTHPGKFQSADGAWFLIAEDRPTPLQIGCDPTGVTDETVKMKGLFATGRAFITGGTYLISDTLYIPTGVVASIRGDRTGIIKASPTFVINGWMIQHAGNPASHTQDAEVSGFVLDGYAKWPSDLTVPNTTLTNYLGGIYFAEVDNLKIHDMLIKGISNSGVTIKHGDNNAVFDNEFIDGAYRSKVILFLADVVGLVTNSLVYNNKLLRNGPIKAKDASADALYSSCDGIHIDDGIGGKVYNNHIISCGGTAIRIENTPDVDVYENLIEDCGQDGITAYQGGARRIRIYKNTIRGWGKNPYPFALRTYGGLTYIFRETPFPGDGLPDDPATAPSLELCPYSLDGIINIGVYNKNAVAGGTQPNVFPFRGFAAITANQLSEDVYIYDNVIEGNLSKDSSGRYLYASDYGISIFHSVNSPVSIAGNEVWYENNKISNPRVASVNWRDFADPWKSRGPSVIAPSGTKNGISWLRTRDGDMTIWGPAFTTQTAQAPATSTSGLLILPAPFAKTFSTHISLNKTTAPEDVVIPQSRQNNIQSMSWSAFLSSSLGSSQDYSLDMSAKGRWRLSQEDVPDVPNPTYAFSSWATTGNITRTLNFAKAPNGKIEATKIEATANGNTNFSRTFIGVGKAGGNVYEIYLKRGSGDLEANRVTLRNSTTATDLLSVRMNHGTRVVDTYFLGANAKTVKIDLLADGWYRLLLIATSGISAGDDLTLYAGFAGGVETAGRYVLAWGPDLL